MSFDGVRVALTEQQIDEHGLPMDPITTRDSRSKAWIAEGRADKCELESLPPDVIAAELRARIEEHTDKDVRDEVLDRERLEAAALKSLPSGISFLPALRAEIKERPLQLLYPSPASRAGDR